MLLILIMKLMLLPLNDHITADNTNTRANNPDDPPAADIEQEPRTNQHSLIDANTAHTDKEKPETDTGRKKG